MELELGLSLPPATLELNGTVNPIEKWPNAYYEDNGTTPHHGDDSCLVDDETTSSAGTMTTLPLFVWTGRRPPEDDHNNTSKGRRSRFVKVKMAGEAIIRKIDLNRYDSYHSLTHSLLYMFAKCGTSKQSVDEDCGSYTLSYQDEAGNWRLAGEVPWQKFCGSVQRMEILRTSDGRLAMDKYEPLKMTQSR